MIVLAAASIALAASTEHPATDELRVLGWQVPKLLAAQVLGVASLAILGIGFVRRRPLRRAGAIVLMLALVTAALLVATIIRRYR